MAESALVVGILLLIACLLALLLVRRIRLLRGGGVDLSLRRRPRDSDGRAVGRDAAAGWRFGIARYRGDELAWYRLTSLRLGPSVVLDRMDLQIVDRRSLLDGESDAIPEADAVLNCRSHGADLEVAMAPEVLTGFLSWLEAAPPGRSPGYRHQVP